MFIVALFTAAESGEPPRCLTQRYRNGVSGVHTPQLSAGVKDEAAMLAAKWTLLEVTVVKEVREPPKQVSCISSHFWLPDCMWVQQLIFIYCETRAVWGYKATCARSLSLSNSVTQGCFHPATVLCPWQDRQQLFQVVISESSTWP